jgi:hypothetical protein
LLPEHAATLVLHPMREQKEPSLLLLCVFGAQLKKSNGFSDPEVDPASLLHCSVHKHREHEPFIHVQTEVLVVAVAVEQW